MNIPQMTKSASQRAERHPMVLRGRISWKDSRGTARFASVMTRDISESGVFIEWHEPASIPMYRLVTLQIERDVRSIEGLPPALRSGRVLSAVYRHGAFQRSTGTPEGYGLRLLVEPATAATAAADPVQATA